jgi:hypothetical protein
LVWLRVWRIASHSSLPMPYDFIPRIFGNNFATVSASLALD